jgi:hypothetical protein
MIAYQIEKNFSIEINACAATREEAKKLAEERLRSTEDQLQLLAPLRGSGGIDVILQGKATWRWFDEETL